MPETRTEPKLEALTAVEAIRRRPGLAFAADGRAPLANLALREGLCLSRDAAWRGCCRTIHLTLRARGEALVADDGPGLSLARDADGVTWAERAFTVLGVCAEAKPKDLARTACDVGLVALNALCARLELELHQGSEHWTQSFTAGVADAPLRRAGSTEARGLRLHLCLDPAVVDQLEFDLDELTAWLLGLREGATIVLHDARVGAHGLISAA